MRYYITIDFLYEDAMPRRSWYIDLIADNILSSWQRTDEVYSTTDRDEAVAKVAWLNQRLKPGMLDAELVEMESDNDSDESEYDDSFDAFLDGHGEP